MENFDNFCHEHMCKKLQNENYLPKTAYRSLETVNALHQTVVTLGKSLEEAKLEINSLKTKIGVKESIKERQLYRCRDTLSLLNKPEKNYSDSDKTYDNCELSSIFVVNSGSEISHCRNQRSQIDIFQNSDSIDQSSGSYIETEKLENIFKKRSAHMAANMDVKIRLTSNTSNKDRENDSNSTSVNNSGKLLT